MIRQNQVNNGIFVQPIDQGYSQENYEKEKEKDLLNEFNILEKIKFYDNLIDDEEVVVTQFRPLDTPKITIRKKKNKFKLLLKPKWEEKISLMKTNAFLYFKNYVIRNISSCREFLIKICDILKFILMVNIKLQ